MFFIILCIFFFQINAFITCGKLKSAYLIAVKGNRVEAIKEIAEIALNAGQSNLVDICNKFLNQYKRKKEDQERKGAQGKQGKESKR